MLGFIIWLLGLVGLDHQRFFVLLVRSFWVSMHPSHCKRVAPILGIPRLLRSLPGRPSNLNPGPAVSFCVGFPPAARAHVCVSPCECA